MERKFLIGFAAVCTVVSVVADPIKAGWRETGGTDVSSGRVTQNDPVVVGSGGTFAKTGAGELRLSMAQVNSSFSNTFEVLNGTLTLSPGTDSTVNLSSPPAVFAKAAYWCAADSANLVTTTDGDKERVSKWCDVRETNTASPTYNSSTKGGKVSATYPGTIGGDVAPEVVTKDGVRAVYFGGSASGQWLKFAKDLPNTYHIFAVHGVYDCLGAVVSYTGNGGWLIQAGSAPPYSTLTTKGSHFPNDGMRGDMQKDMFTAGWWLDGQKFDPWYTVPKKGFQLLESSQMNQLTTVNNFFNQRNFANSSSVRQGGDYLAEAVIFTNRLTEAERLDVECWLLKKYGLDGKNAATNSYSPLLLARSTDSVAVAGPAALKVDVGAGETFGPLNVSGEGALVKTGAGRLVLGPTWGLPYYTGLATLEAGSFFVQGGPAPLLARATAGERVSSDWTIATRGTMDVTNWHHTAGMEITRATDAGAGTFVKDGGGVARVASVGEGVKSLKVDAGMLVLESPVTEAAGALPTNGGALAATVPNPGFEEIPESAIDNREYVFSDISNHPEYGWTSTMRGRYLFYATNGVAVAKQDGPWGAYVCNWKDAVFPPVEGVKALYLHGNMGVAVANAKTTVNFPVAGTYELSFAAAPRRQKESYRMQFGVFLTYGEGDVRRVGTLVECDTPWIRRHVLLRDVPAGDHALEFRTIGSVFRDDGLAIDDVKIRYVARPVPAPAFRIPNGDFEEYVPDTSFRNIVTSEPICSNWTFTVDAGWTGTFEATSITNGPVAVVNAASYMKGNGKDTRMGITADKVYGSSQLAFITQYGSAATTFTFAAPGGLFRLKGRLANWRTSLLKNPTLTSTETGFSATPQIRATLTRNGGTAIDLGQVSYNGHDLGDVTWPNAAELAEGDTVALTLKPDNNCLALLDDLVFVTSDSTDDGELITNGACEGTFNRNWYGTIDKEIFTYGSGEFCDSINRASDYGYATYEGRQYMTIGQRGGATQLVNFAEIGLHRLVFAAKSRQSENSSHNPINVWLVDPDGDRVDIAYVKPDGTNFVEYAYYFNVAKAGVHTFCLKGNGVDTTNATENRRTILDGFSIKKVKDVVAQAPSAPSKMKISVAANAQLCLNFPGTLKCGPVTIAGTVYTGEISASVDPIHLTGMGSLLATPSGTMVILR